MVNTKEKQKKIIWGLIIILSSVSVFILPLVKFNHQFIARDWTLYNCYSYLIKSSWLHYHTLPLHQPYILGGLDLLASPQSRVFSPLSIFDLFLPAPYANLFSLITLSIIGAIGMYKLLIFLKVSKQTSLLCVFIYTHATWFSLHFTEGHVVFESFQLMSLILYFTLNLTKINYKIYLCTLLAFMVLDGGMYAFIYSSIFILFCYIFRINGISILALVKSIKSQKKYSLLAIFIFISLSSARFIPLLSLHHNRIPVLENIQLDFKSLLHAFFNPYQHVQLTISGASFHDYGIRFHEIGSYIGILSFSIIIIFFVRNFQKTYIPYILLILFFFWIGSGIGGSFNPWKLFQQIPIINNAHIQTRALFLVYFILVILLAFSVDFLRIKSKRWVNNVITILLIVEALFVSNIPFYETYKSAWSLSSSDVFDGLLKNTTVEKTILSPGNGWGKDFELFENKNIASKGFIDDAVSQGEIKSIDDKDYKGEVYFLSGTGNANVYSFTPNGLVVDVNTSNQSEIQFNTNYLLKWISSNDNVDVFNKNGLLTIKTPKMNGRVTLKYQPSYIFIIIPLYLIGLLAFLSFIFKKPISKKPILSEHTY